MRRTRIIKRILAYPDKYKKTELENLPYDQLYDIFRNIMCDELVIKTHKYSNSIMN
jgi:hypothetical protein